MKTISLATACRGLALFFPLILFMHVSATDYQTFYVEDINNEDTTIYCSGTDSLRFIPPAGLDVYAWLINSHADTFFVDTLIIPHGYEGLVACQGNFDSRQSYFFPLSTETGGSIEIICGGTGMLGVSINSGDVLSYKWSPSSGLNNDAVQEPEAEVTEETTYYVTITMEGGCVEKDSMTVSVNPLTVNAGQDKSLVCGGSVQFDQPVSNYTGSGSLTYAWLPTEGLNNAGIARPSAEITEDRTYVLSISTSNGCMAENSISVTVNPLTATVNHSDVFCGTETQLNVVSNYTGTETLSYSWTPTGGLSASNIANPKVSLIGNMSYSVDVQTHNGCIATATTNLEPGSVNYNASICVVSVDENDYNIVVWGRSENTAIASFNVYRESSYMAGSYDLVGIVPRTEPGVFIDSTSDASVHSNKYKIAAKDICGFVTDMSPEHKTMHLTVNKGQSNTWNLIWEPYEGISVSNYKIYRGSKISNMAEIGVTSGSNTTYTDENVTGTHSYYQIEMTLPFICNNLKSTQYTSSRSNIISTGDITGIINLKEESVQVFPNPLVDMATVRFSNPRNDIYQLVLLDLTGKILMVMDGISEDQVHFNRNGFPAGLYLLELRGPVIYRTKILIK